MPQHRSDLELHIVEPLPILSILHTLASALQLLFHLVNGDGVAWHLHLKKFQQMGTKHVTYTNFAQTISSAVALASITRMNSNVYTVNKK